MFLKATLCAHLTPEVDVTVRKKLKNRLSKVSVVTFRWLESQVRVKKCHTDHCYIYKILITTGGRYGTAIVLAMKRITFKRNYTKSKANKLAYLRNEQNAHTSS